MTFLSPPTTTAGFGTVDDDDDGVGGGVGGVGLSTGGEEGSLTEGTTGLLRGPSV